MISKYEVFLNEKIFESLINESVIYYTPKFKITLNKLKSKSQIASDLLDIDKTDVSADMTFIDMCDEEGYFTFTQMKNILSVMTNTYKDSNFSQSLDAILDKIKKGDITHTDVTKLYNESPFLLKDKARNKARIGRLITQLFPNKYSPKEVEDFVNLFKGINNGTNFKLVEGNDIITYYNENRYIKMSGDLGNSCMRYNKCSTFFNIYTKNPDVCKLLILLSEEDPTKIKGRVIIWKINPISFNGKPIESVEYYMDRIYAIDDTTKAMFEEYADKKGWLKRLTSRYCDYGYFKLGPSSYYDVRVRVQLDNWKFEQYPYLDTFKQLELKSGLLRNDEDTDETGCYIMTSTDGTVINTSMVYSEYYDERIPREEAIYSEMMDSYLYINRSIEVKIGRRAGIFPNDYDNIVKDHITQQWMHETDGYHSDWYNDYILRDNCVTVVINTSSMLNTHKKTGVTLTTRILSVLDPSIIKFTELDCASFLRRNIDNSTYFLSDILSQNEDSKKYYLIEHEIEIFKTRSGDFSRIDCDILGIKIDKQDKTYYTDTLTYNYGLSAALMGELSAKALEKIDKSKSIAKKTPYRIRLEEITSWIIIYKFII